MERNSSTTTINKTAALQIKSIRDAYTRIGVTCGPARPVLRPMVSRLKDILDFRHAGLSQEQRFEGMA